MSKRHTSGEVLMGSLREAMRRSRLIADEAQRLVEPGQAVQFTLSAHEGDGSVVCAAILLAGTPEQNGRVLAAVKAVEREMMLEAGRGFIMHDFDTRRDGWERDAVLPGHDSDVEQ